MTVAFLGPEGTFTHIAAQKWLAKVGSDQEQRPFENAGAVIAAVESGAADLGVIPIENTIEGVVVPSLDALLAAPDVIGIAEVVLPISFDAFVLPEPVVEPVFQQAAIASASERERSPQLPVEPTGADALTEAVAHPHALAQVTRFIAENGLRPVPASSNAAACRDLHPGQVAFGPADCGPTYGLNTLATAVEDYHGAQTRFLVVHRRTATVDQSSFCADAAAASRIAGAVANSGSGLHADSDLVSSFCAERSAVAESRPASSPSVDRPIRTVLAITPSLTGPGVLARIANAFGGLGVNMSSLVTRPIKAQRGQYIFIVTFDAAPWDPAAKAVFAYLLSSGDSLKTLAVYEADAEHDALESVLPEKVPIGSVNGGAPAEEIQRALKWDMR